MALTLYNTLDRRKAPLTPLIPGQVAMYCCGVTVYDYCHLGHARCYISWDLLRRYLLWSGYKVTYIQNFTDIDDKILKRAVAEGSSMDAVSERFIAAYLEDMDRLNVMRADDYPRATHTIDGIKRLIHELEQKSIAYASGGDVYYSVSQFPDYGKLSGHKLDELQDGASGRVSAEDSLKRAPQDFALWKAAKPGEPAWDSDWGSGRPGWHIECSAMVRDRLGDAIDIHMGGADLIFPHHENEIAQSEAVTGVPLARHWLHNGMVNIDNEKMSKSLGNFTTIRDLLDQGGINPMVLRLFVLQGHYRKPIDFTQAAIEAATNSWDTLKDGLLFGVENGVNLGWAIDQPFTNWLKIDGNTAIDRFNQAMDDDLNTAGALAVLFELAKELRRQGNVISHGGAVDGNSDGLYQQWLTLEVLADVLGLKVEPIVAVEEIWGADDIENLIADRAAAKVDKNWGEADRIRNLLKADGIELIDQPGGATTWIRG
jgi:cysteinyl-tRNA synthetase